MNHKKLIVFIFSPESGANNDFLPYGFAAVVDGGNKEVDTAYLEDGIASFFEADTQYDTEEEAIKEVLDASGYQWEYADKFVPECGDGSFIMNV